VAVTGQEQEARRHAGAFGQLLRRRRTWVLIVGVLVLSVLFARLSQWQWDRHEQRDSRNAATRAALAAVPAPLPEVVPDPAAPAPAGVEWRRVTVSGRYDGEHALLVRYRPLDSEPGFEVLAPLVTSDAAVWVDRGWVPAPSGSSAEPPLPTTPTGEVSVTGYVRASEPAAGSPDPGSGSVRTVSLPALSSWLGRPAYPVYVSATQETPSPAAAPKRLPVVQLSGGPHVSYAVQWVLFALIALTGLVKFLGDDLKEIRAVDGRSRSRERVS
jgi:cytochrome oxidase assembly protein ShyY1